MKKVAIAFAVLITVGCSSSNQKAIDAAHTAQNSLDWAGVYQGVLPCADCEGITTTLTLNYDNTFKLEEAYKKGNMTFMPQATIGQIEWDKSRPLVSLKSRDDQRVFFVGEGRVIAYDLEGNPIDSQLNYSLTQIQTFVENSNEQTMIKEIEVGPKLVDCQGVGPMQCLLVREKGTQDWLLHYEPIDGFDYEAGFNYQLKIEEIKLNNVPADRSTISWKLVAVISKTPLN